MVVRKLRWSGYLLGVTLALVLVGMYGGIKRDVAPVHADSSTCSPARPHASGSSDVTIVSGAYTRTYRLHVPPAYTGASAVPLVFNIHGRAFLAWQQEAYTNFSAKSDASGFIVVYPQGLTTAADPIPHFNAWQVSSPEPDDVAFVSDVLDALENQLCINRTRVFSTGMSNGAMLSVRLACSLSGRIAAIAPVGGMYEPPMSIDPTLNPAETCPDTAPRPVLAFHGTSDTYVPFNGGVLAQSMINYRLPIDDATPSEDVLSDWAAHNGCTGSRAESIVSSEVRLITYGACAQNADVQLYAIDGGGHTWPGSPYTSSQIGAPLLGYTTNQISANDLMWTFFSAHPLAAPPASVGGIAESPDVAALPTAAASGRDHHKAYIVGAVFTFLLAACVAAWRTRLREEGRHVISED